MNPSSLSLLTIDEAAELLKIAPRTLFRWLAEGRLPALRTQNTTRIRYEDLLKFIEQHVTTTTKGTARRGAP